VPDRDLTRLERKIVLDQTRKALREIEAGDVGGAEHTLHFLRDWLYEEEERRHATPGSHHPPGSPTRGISAGIRNRSHR
jgi:hypothetical protein